MSKVVVFGIGPIAEVVDFYLKKDSEHEVAAFTVDGEYMKESSFHGTPVLAFEDIRENFPPEKYKMFVPIGYKSMNKIREEKYLEAKKMGYSFIRYISSRASYYGSQVGENCFILENNVIQPYSVIGDNTILWSGNHLGHHSVIGKNCFVASHVVISGNVRVGDNSFLGVNATIRDNVKIGSYNLIGAGAVILKDTADFDVFAAKGATQKIDRKSTELSHI